MTVDISRIIKDLLDIVAGIRARDWRKVLAAALDIIDAIGASSVPVPMAAPSEQFVALASWQESDDLDDVAAKLEALASEMQADPAAVGGGRLVTWLGPLILGLIRRLLAGNVPS